MSATIGNLNELALFLDAEVFTKDFRPVELKEYIKYGNDIMNINWKASDINEKIVYSRTIDYGYSSQIEKLDPDHLGGLVMEIIPNGSCLIFCPTKKNCENVAILLCKVIAKKIFNKYKLEKDVLIKVLKEENKGDNLLVSLVPWGVAYHHSGLASEERKLIENAFRSGILCVLCCTSTLAAGVNLPAQRVILRAPMVGNNFMTLSTYKQMVGRAGRAGFGGHGDSIVICAPHHKEKLQAIISSPMDDVCSSLHISERANMKMFLLSAIASGSATNRKELKDLIMKSLLHVQSERLKINVKLLLNDAIRELYKMRAIILKNTSPNSTSLNTSANTDPTLCTDNTVEMNMKDNKITVFDDLELIVSDLGKAAVKGGMELSRAHQLYEDLKRAQKNLVVIGIIHLLYLVTPYDLAESIRPVLSTYSSILSTISRDGKQTSRILGFTETTGVQMEMGRVPKNIPENVFNRFYVTLMLNDLWNQVPLQIVSDKYQVNKGKVQSMMEQAASFASGVYRFCEELEEFWAFKELLPKFIQNLSHCCVSELGPLMELPSVKKNRALQLYKAGYKTIKSIAQANPNDLVDSIEHMPMRTANQLIASAKLLLLEKVENLKEEVQNVMEDLGIDKQ